MPRDEFFATDGGWRTTCWSRIAAAGQDDDPGARRESLELLCRLYARPIRQYLRRALKVGDDEAEDLEQEFFVHLIDRDVLARADPTVGRFRFFIKEVLRNFVHDQRRRQSRQKRGGGQRPISLDSAREDGRVLDVEKGDGPDEVLDRQWARRILELALENLEEVLRREGKDQDLALFREYADPPPGAGRPTYKELGGRHGLSEWVVWKRLKGLRERLRAAMADQVALTVRDADAVEEELQALSAHLID